jgi:hypothetical protein
LVNAYAAVNSVAPSISGPSTVCSGNATFTVSNAPIGYTWGYSSSLTLVSTSGNSATFSKNGGGIASVSVSIIVGGVTVATKYFTIGAVPDMSSISYPSNTVTIGCEYGDIYGFIPQNLIPSSQSVDEYQWRGTVSTITIVPHPSGYIYKTGDYVRILTNGYNYGGIEIRAHNYCGWSDWVWVAAIYPCN